MEIVLGVILAIVTCFLFYKMLSLTVKIFLWATVIGAALSGVGLLFSGVSPSSYTGQMDEITSGMCQQPDNECISKIIKNGHIALVIVRSPVCVLCKVNKVASLTTTSFVDLALDHNVEVIYTTPDAIGNKYPDILMYADKKYLPLNVVFSRANPFGRTLNRLLTRGYIIEQLEEEADMCRLMANSSHGSKDRGRSQDVDDILNTLKERERANMAVRSSVI